jgi:DNA-binding transcriptional regulator YhcF (GntR family)
VGFVNRRIFSATRSFFENLRFCNSVERLVMKTNSPRPSARPAELPLLEQLTINQSEAEPKSLAVLRLLRRIARQCQTEHAHPFYPVRAAAAHFGLSRATIARLYQQLSSEGLLRLVWGAKTRLEPLASTRRRKPQTIAIAVDLCRFSTSLDYRLAILDLQRELWRSKVADRLIFFQNAAEEVVRLCHRYHVHRVDTVIWLAPGNVSPAIFAKLSTLGLRLICIAANPVAGARECYLPPPGCTIGRLVRDQILNPSGSAPWNGHEGRRIGSLFARPMGL